MRLETKNKKKYTIYRFIPMAVLMILIFAFSATPGDESSQQSGFFVELLSKTYSGLSAKALSPETLAFLGFIVRKTAHFTEYAVLAGSVLFAFHNIFIEPKKLYLVSLLVSHLYAASDEIHQYFVPGRVCAYKDVLIDTAGALTLVIVYALIKWRKSIKLK